MLFACIVLPRQVGSYHRGFYRYNSSDGDGDGDGWVSCISLTPHKEVLMAPPPAFSI